MNYRCLLLTLAYVYLHLLLHLSVGFEDHDPHGGTWEVKDPRNVRMIPVDEWRSAITIFGYPFVLQEFFRGREMREKYLDDHVKKLLSLSRRHEEKRGSMRDSRGGTSQQASRITIMDLDQKQMDVIFKKSSLGLAQWQGRKYFALAVAALWQVFGARFVKSLDNLRGKEHPYAERALHYDSEHKMLTDLRPAWILNFTANMLIQNDAAGWFAEEQLSQEERLSLAITLTMQQYRSVAAATGETTAALKARVMRLLENYHEQNIWLRSGRGEAASVHDRARHLLSREILSLEKQLLGLTGSAAIALQPSCRRLEDVEASATYDPHAQGAEPSFHVSYDNNTAGLSIRVDYERSDSEDAMLPLKRWVSSSHVMQKRQSPPDVFDPRVSVQSLYEYRLKTQPVYGPLVMHRYGLTYKDVETFHLQLPSADVCRVYRRARNDATTMPRYKRDNEYINASKRFRATPAFWERFARRWDQQHHTAPEITQLPMNASAALAQRMERAYDPAAWRFAYRVAQPRFLSDHLHAGAVSLPAARALVFGRREPGARLSDATRRAYVRLLTVRAAREFILLSPGARHSQLTANAQGSEILHLVGQRPDYMSEPEDSDLGHRGFVEDIMEHLVRDVGKMLHRAFRDHLLDGEDGFYADRNVRETMRVLASWARGEKGPLGWYALLAFLTDVGYLGRAARMDDVRGEEREDRIWARARRMRDAVEEESREESWDDRQEELEEDDRAEGERQEEDYCGRRENNFLPWGTWPAV